MEERISGNTKAEIFSFDFRCRSDDETLEKNHGSIWLATLYGDEEIKSFLNIVDFMDYILELSMERNICLYCFDLGFHWSFCFYDICRRGFKFANRITKKSKNEFNAFGTGSASLIYSAQIRAKGAKGQIFMKDLKMVYQGFRSIEEMAKTWKSELVFYPDDLEKKHPIGAEPTNEEKMNSISRSRFVFDVLKAQEGNTAFFQSFTLASFTIKNAIQYAFGWAKNPFAVYRSFKMYPRIKDEKEKEALRLSIKGGLSGPTIAAIDNDYKFDCELFILDRTQSYPSEMKQSRMPRGKGEYFMGYQLLPKRIHLYHVLIKSFDGVRIHSIPILMQNHIHFMPRGMAEPIDAWMWEWEYYQAQITYINIDMEVIEGYAYKHGVCPFWKYVEENQKQRKECELKGDYIGAGHRKALNVSLYGKLIQRDKKQHTTQFLNAETGILDTETEDRENAKEATYIYLPAGSCIPSLARFHMIQLALEFGPENVVYIETDALAVISNERTRAVLDSMELGKELGQWHLESNILKAYFPMAKRYKYLTEEGNVVVKGAGLKFDEILGSYDDVKLLGTEVEMRQRKQVSGGMVLAKVRKKLKELKDIAEDEEDFDYE